MAKKSWIVRARVCVLVAFTLVSSSCRAWHNGEPTVQTHISSAQFQNPVASFNHPGSEISLATRVQQFMQDNLRISGSHGAPSSFRYASNMPAHHADFVRALANSSQPYITWFFNNQIMAGAMTESQVLRLYKLYSNPNFLAYIKQLPGYDEHILSVYGQLVDSGNQRKKIFQEMGLRESIGLFNFFAKCAQEVRDKRAVQEQERALRAQVAKLQQEEFARNLRKTELAQQKSIAEQRVAAGRPPTALAHCVAVWHKKQHGPNGARYKKRIAAVQELADNKPATKRVYKITDRDRDLIKELNLKKSDFVKLEGNELQHALHREFIGITRAISDTRTLTVGSITGQSWTELLGTYLYTGMQINKTDNCAQASKIADFCWAVTDGLGQIIVGAGEGVWQGGKNIAHAVCHPLDTAYGAGQAIGMLIIGCSKIIMGTGDPDLPIDHEFSAFRRVHDPANTEYILRLYDGLMMQARQASCRDIARGISTAVTEAVATGMLCSAAAQCVNSVGKRVPGAMQHVLGCVPEAAESFALAEGGQVRFSKGALQALAESEVKAVGNATKHAVHVGEHSLREKVFPKVHSYEQALNQALELIGDVDVHSGAPHIGRIGVGKGKIVGRDWHGQKVIMRLDYDPIKGPHLNVSDYRMGKGLSGVTVAIPFEGSEKTVESLLRHFNTKASLKAAKSIFEKTGNHKYLATILKSLEKFNS